MRDLRRYLRDVRRGVRSIGLRTQITPEIWQKVRQTLDAGNEEALAALWMSVMGNASELLAGASLHGAQAIVYFNDMQIEVYTRVREQAHHKQGLDTVARALAEHERVLFSWVYTGNTGVDTEALNEVGATMLDTAQARMAAASPFLASCAVLHEVMRIFASDQEGDKARAQANFLKRTEGMA